MYIGLRLIHGGPGDHDPCQIVRTFYIHVDKLMNYTAV